MKVILRLLVVLLVGLMALTVSAQEQSEMAPRLLLADSTGVVHVMDTEAGEIVTAFDMHEEMEEAPRLYVGPSGQYVFAVLRASNMVRVIDSGYTGGELGEPTLLDFTLQTMMPTHFDIYGDHIVSFNDGDGSVTVFTEAIFNGGGTATTFFTGQSHHGVGVMVDETLIATNPTPEAFLPVGPAVFNMDGEIVAAFDNCPGLHGKGVLADGRVVFGCDDGVSIISRSGDNWVTTKIAEDAEARIGNFTYYDETGLLLGNWGADSYALVDVDAGTISEITLPLNIWIAPPAFNPLNADEVIVLTHDGSLHTVEAVTGEVVATAAEIITAYEEPEDEDASVPRPALAIAGGHAYLSDPIAGTLHIINLSDMSEVAVMELGVHITSIAVLGATSEAGSGI
ncbi:hypothetical protein HC928_00715 [bacterium]|nr:hypothetical protein [bacterium]